MRANKHLLLWASIGTLILLVMASIQEGFFQEWQQAQSNYKSASSGALHSEFPVQLRQIVVPSLSAVDRCISCHVGMAPGEEGFTGEALFRPHSNVVHNPADFGCVVCHGGQGRATISADAHGSARHWPSPMLPEKYVYAGCGGCHTHLAVSNINEIMRGEALIERYDCLACHIVDGRGGTLRPGSGEEIVAVDLSRIGMDGWDAGWNEEHLKKHNDAREGLWRYSYGHLDAEEIDQINAYLSTLVGAPGLIKAKALFHSLGCRGCHKVGGVGGDDGPDLTQAGQKDPGQLDFSNVPGEPTVANWMAEHLRFPGRIVPGSQMPYFGFSKSEIEMLTYYTLSLRRSQVPEAFWPRDRIQAERFNRREFAGDGRTLFGTFCAACHGSNGEGMRYVGMPPFPAIGNPDFLSEASDRFLLENIRRGRPGRRMPSWETMEGGLIQDEIGTLAVFVRTLSQEAVSSAVELTHRTVDGDPDSGESRYEKSCSGCHGADGTGAEGPALSNQVFLETASDGFLLNTIKKGRRGTAMKGFQNPSPVQPILSRREIEDIVTFIRTWE